MGYRGKPINLAHKKTV
ncbi:uncharacterized protein FTOL_13740 [Fusarium torulosum]|uniref:Uncharacterized protein n=1 Tax=Fusarium torulosum TaxID=33205 RepID=A0AAE8SQ69_9HYPO|nr:uncharacterized protein FTOL_13740 [Fusarium torulosum]